MLSQQRTARSESRDSPPPAASLAGRATKRERRLSRSCPERVYHQRDEKLSTARVLQRVFLKLQCLPSISSGGGSAK